MKTALAIVVALICTPTALTASPCPLGKNIGQLEVILPGSKSPIVSGNIIQGTRAAQLKNGPGHYVSTAFPGQGETVGIAGHRTTYGAWFNKLADFPKGTIVRLHMSWPRKQIFCYRISGQRVVLANDVSVIRKRGYELLVMTACHPKGQMTHRIVAFAWPAKC